ALIYGTARRLWDERIALACGLLAALYGPFVFYESQLMVATLSTFLHAWLLYAVVGLLVLPDRRRRHWLVTRLVWGPCAVTRASALILPVGVAVLFAPFRPRWQSAAMLLAGLCLAIAPVALRNRLVAHESVLITDSGGLNFYLGNGPGAIGTFRIPPELPGATSAQEQFKAFRAAAEQATGRSLSSREVDAFWTARTWAAIAAAPARWLRLLVEKIWLFWNARELPNTEDYAFARELNPVLALPLVQASFLLPPALIGTLLLLLSRRREQEYVGLTNLVLCLSVALF